MSFSDTISPKNSNSIQKMFRVLLLIFSNLLLLGFTTQAYSCACCGIDDTWYKHDFSSEDYQYKQILELHFTGDYFSDDGYEKLYEIIDVGFDKKKLEFVGPIFKAVLLLEDKGTHSRQDITFVVRPESPLTDEAVIFHEVVIDGQISLQEAGGSKTNHPAKLIMQGVGNACLSEDSLTKWMLKIEDNDLTAGGKLNFKAPTIDEPEAKEKE